MFSKWNSTNKPTGDFKVTCKFRLVSRMPWNQWSSDVLDEGVMVAWEGGGAAAV